MKRQGEKKRERKKEKEAAAGHAEESFSHALCGERQGR